MEQAYEPGAWQAYFQAIVAAAAALLGLLFVAASLRIAVVTDSARHRARAREALGQLLVLVILGVLVLVTTIVFLAWSSLQAWWLLIEVP
jgi:modulator of FtsH protease